MKALGRRSIASFVRSVLDTAWWVIAIGLALTVILLALSIFIDVPGNNLTLSLPVTVKIDAPIYEVHADTNAQIEKMQGNLRFPARKGAFLSGSVAAVALMLGFLLWLVTQLRYVFRSLSQRLPFVAENARRIHRVGLGVIIAEIGRAAIVYFWSYYTSRHFTASGMRFGASADMNPITIVGGLAILVIAEVFREGARLQEDQSLTI